MQILPPSARAALNSVANCLDREMSRSTADNGAQTARSRRANYLIWCKNKDIESPVGEGPLYLYLAGCYARDVIDGHNCLKKKDMRSDTLKKYLGEVNALFQETGKRYQ